MSARPTQLRAHATGGLVGAILYDQLTPDALFDAEEQWCVARVRLLREIGRAGVEQADWPQSSHWNWAYKAALLGPDRLGAFGDVRLFGIAAESQWQGLLYGICEGHFTRLGASGEPLVYVDFLETAPWNWEVQGLQVRPKFRGAGAQLMELAAYWSLLLGYEGRVGLHALAQAEGFYRGRCGMTDLGADAGYHDMRYFEFTVEQARAFLTRRP